MKKFYFLFVFTAFLVSASAQDFTYQNATQYVSGPPDATLAAHADIYNSSSQSLDVMCRISSATMATPRHRKYFCFGDFCYDTSVTVSAVPTTIAPNQSGLLSAYVIPQGDAGITTVTYQFYDQSGNSDTLTMTFTYEFTEVGVPELSGSAYSLESAGPNPANNLTAIKYHFAPGKDAKLVLQNLLGVRVKEIKLRETSNTLIIPVSDLVNGIYLYTLVIDGKPAASRKLVVAHK